MINDITLLSRVDVAIKQLMRIADALEKIAGEDKDAQIQTNNKKFIQQTTKERYKKWEQIA